MNNMSLEEYLAEPPKKQQAQQAQQQGQQSLDAYLGQPAQQMQQPAQQAAEKGFWGKLFDPTTLGASAKQAVTGLADTANTYGGRIAEGLTKGIETAINTPADVVNYFTGKQTIPKADFSGMQAPFVNRNNQIAELLGKGAELLPSIGVGGGVAAGLKGAPMFANFLANSPRLANLAANAAGGFAGGMAGDENNRLAGGILGTALPVGIGVGKAGYDVGKNVLTALKNPSQLLSGETQNFLRGLGSGKGLPSQVDNPNLGMEAAQMGNEFNPSMLSGAQQSPLANAVSNAASQKSPNVLRTILQGNQAPKGPIERVPDFGELNKSNNQGIVAQYKTQIKPITQAKYKNFENLAEEAGFKPEVKVSYDAKGNPINADGQKMFKFENHEEWQPFNDVLESKKTTFTNAVGKDAMQAIRDLKSNPSPQQAQKAISQLGKSYRKLEFKVESSDASDSQIKAYDTMKELQASLQGGLKHTLESNGASNAHAALQDADKWFATNDLPYKKAPGIKALFNDEVSNPANILQTLQQDNPYTDMIRSHIQKNKSLQDALLKQHLSKGVAIRQNAGGGSKVYSKSGPFSAVEKNYAEMPNSLQDLLHPETKNELETLLSKSAGLSKLGSTLTKLGAAGGIGSGVYEYFK